MSGSSSFRRNPLIITGNSLSSGDRTATFAKGNPDSLLRSYLIFVRDMRGQRREPSIELRSEDITVLAHHLGVTEELVLGGLLDLMGATRAQRSTMLAMLAAGALTIVLSGTIVSNLSADGVSVEMERLADAVQAAVSGSDDDTATSASIAAATTPAAPPANAPAAANESTAAATAPSAAPAPAAEPLREAIATSDDAPRSGVARLVEAATTPTPDVLRSVAAAGAASSAGTPSEATADAGSEATSVLEPVESAPGAVAQEPVSIGIAPDGSLVGSVAPPVPATPDDPVATGQLPDGTTVGVAAPPVPPVPPDEQVATGELADGTIVGVGAPPVPPTPQD